MLVATRKWTTLLCHTYPEYGPGFALRAHYNERKGWAEAKEYYRYLDSLTAMGKYPHG